VFGYWPTFHDAEVLRLTLSRERTTPGVAAPFIDLDVYAFDTDGTLTPEGYYRLTNEVVVSFRFHEVEAVRLEGFNQQNVLWELTVTPGSESDGRPVLEVDLPSSFGVEGSFQCRTAEVLTVRPWADGRTSGSQLRDA
jgi:hypothetical protein